MENNTKWYYILIVDGGVEIHREGPFSSFIERDAAARRIWQEEDDTSGSFNIFWADVDSNGGRLETGSFDDLNGD